MTDVVFFLKAYPSKEIQALPWGDVKLIGVDPPPNLMCEGKDPRCSTAYSNMWQWLKDADGRVLPNFLAHYAKGIEVGRIAFVGFSAAHGFLNPLTDNDADRADIDALILMDASFGGGKTGYRKYVVDAAKGTKLFATTTAFTGGDTSFSVVWAEAEDELGMPSVLEEAKPPMPQPSGGSYRLGELAYYLRYVDPNNPKSGELPHWEMGKVIAPMLEAYLIPYWRGDLRGGGAWKAAAWAGALVAMGYLGYRLWRTRTG